MCWSLSQTPVAISQSPVNTFTSLPQVVNNVRASTNVNISNISNLNGMINSLTQTNVGPILNNVTPAISAAAAMSQGIGLTNLQPRQNPALNGVVSNVSSNSPHNADHAHQVTCLKRGLALSRRQRHFGQL